MDRNDPRCGHHFRLGAIDKVFDVCLGSFHGCMMYHRLNRETIAAANGAALQPRFAPAALTSHGHTVALRPTGS